MEQVLEAIYSQGVLKPLAKLDLPENQRVNIIVSVPDVDEIEAVALDRGHFFNRQP